MRAALSEALGPVLRDLEVAGALLPVRSWRWCARVARSGPARRPGTWSAASASCLLPAGSADQVVMLIERKRVAAGERAEIGRALADHFRGRGDRIYAFMVIFMIAKDKRSDRATFEVEGLLR